MKVLKFGGTSMGTPESFEQVVLIVKQQLTTTDKLALIVSACGKTTDNLLLAADLAKKQDIAYQNILSDIFNQHNLIIQKNLDPKKAAQSISFLQEKINEIDHILESIFHLTEFSDQTYDKLLSYGEGISSYLIAQKLIEDEVSTEWVDSRKVIKTNSDFSRAKVNFIETNSNIKHTIKDKGKIYVFAGFIGSNEQGVTTTLGRGGSDYTASIIAAAMDAEELQIWTDVSGVMTADPRMVSNAYVQTQLSYTEAMELSHFGAKVIYPPTINPVTRKHIPIYIKNTFDPEGGYTCISDETDTSRMICGIPSIKHISLITMQGNGMIGIPGYSKRLLEALSREQINVIMITQASSEHSITIAISPEDLESALHSVNDEFEFELESQRIDPIICEKGLSMVAIVGNNMKNHHGISGTMFNALGKNGVNINAIAQGSSENNITAVIKQDDLKKALNVLHEAFFEEQLKKINLFIVGIGTVGSELIEQIKGQYEFIKEKSNMLLQVVGISNSSNMIFDEKGINLEEYSKLLKKGVEANIHGFVEKAIELNLRNSIFVDNTANGMVASVYEQCLTHGIGVVTCNKIACSSEYARYKELKSLSRRYKAPFLFETNVGAGLPVINTLNDLVKSGDSIHAIKAVLSGSLNFIMNNFKKGTRFVDIVKEAQKQGYTEPDPRIDLSGLDVKRKLLILIRESGVQYDLDQIKSQSFLDDSFFDPDLSIDQFLEKLGENDTVFDAVRDEADAEGKVLKIVAKYEDGEAVVALERVGPEAPYFQLDGSDNIVMFYTARYPKEPMVIKGAGAGAGVTAAGVFGDILRAARN